VFGQHSVLNLNGLQHFFKFEQLELELELELEQLLDDEDEEQFLRLWHFLDFF